MKARTAVEVLDRDFLDVRHRMLDVAASLDRIGRGASPDSLIADARFGQIREALGVLADDRGDKARRVQFVFSRPYEAGWTRTGSEAPG